jgi:hypothetical protein
MRYIMQAKHLQRSLRNREEATQANRVNTTRVAPCVAHAIASQEQEDLLEKEKTSK